MWRNALRLAVLAVLVAPGCDLKTKSIPLQVAQMMTLLDVDSDWGGSGCGPGGQPFGTAPSPPPAGHLRIGYVRNNEPGTDPFPCWHWENYVYRGAVRFDLSPIPQTAGVAGATLSYQATGDCSPIRAAVATKPWTTETDFDVTELPAEVFSDNLPLGAGVHSVTVPVQAVIKWHQGQPNHGIVFVGPSESPGGASKKCLTELNDFQLEVLAGKAQPTP